MTRPAVVALVAAGAVLGAPAATATPTTTTAPVQPNYETYCQPSDPGLAELSGTTFVDGALYGIGDSGTDEHFARLTPECAVQRWIDVPVDPYDIEDMANHDGVLWLSDTGDNLYRRDTVALTRVNPSDGTGELHRLSYPDGKHDAEALLIEPGGRPVILTKEFSGAAGIYVPDGDATVQTLPTPGPTPLTKVGAVMLGPQTYTGVPVPGQLVTGAALSDDGRVAAVRTYGQIFLYPVRGGDVVAALTTETPVTVAAPRQPQGESLAFTSSGDLLVGSENGGEGAPLPPIMVLRDAVDLVAPPEDPTTAASPADHFTQSASWWWAGGAVIAGLAVVAAAVTLRRR